MKMIKLFLFSVFEFLVYLLTGDWGVAGVLNMTTFDPMLKEYYGGQVIENLIYPDNPFYAMVPKMEKFLGRNYPLPVIWGNPQGRSSTFTNAQGNKTDAKLSEFLLIRKKDYGLADIDGETLKASEGDAGAFMEAATVQIDGTMQSVGRSIASTIFRNGSGTIGVVSNSSFATTVLTLTNVQDVVNFEVGMTLTVAANETSSVRSGTLVVTNIDRDAGTVTMSGNLSTGISAIAQNDVIQVQGDYLSKFTGLQGWLPNSAPSSTTFFNVDRSTDVVRLGGVRFDASTFSIEEGLIKGVRQVNLQGGKVSHVFLGYDAYGNLELALGSKVQYVDVAAHNNSNIGFRGITINSGRGLVTVIPDQNCVANRAFAVKMESWKLYSLGPSVQLLNYDGNKILRTASADSYEVRVGGYMQLGSNAPGHNGNFKLA